VVRQRGLESAAKRTALHHRQGDRPGIEATRRRVDTVHTGAGIRPKRFATAILNTLNKEA